MEYKCPLCKQTVSEELYQKITGIWKERKKAEKEFKDKQKGLIKKMQEDERRLKDERKRLKAEQKTIIDNEIAENKKKFEIQMYKIKEANRKLKESFDKRILAAEKVAEIKARKQIHQELKNKMIEAIKKQVSLATSKTQKDLFKANQTIDATRKQMRSLQTQNLKQQDRIRNLETQLDNQTTPQLEGLLYEDRLLDALKKEFPEDKFEHTGKGGDILHFIVCNHKQCGIIVYECKRVLQWQVAHAEQAANAKLQRKADYAILVTSSTKKGGGGFFVEKGVIVVHPGGVIALVNVLRDQLLKIAQFKLNQAQREEAIEKTLEYLRGPEFKNSLDIVIRKTIEMYDDLKKEYQDHHKNWIKRYGCLKTVYSNSAQVWSKTAVLISGKTEEAKLAIEIQPFPALPNLTEI